MGAVREESKDQAVSPEPVKEARGLDGRWLLLLLLGVYWAIYFVHCSREGQPYASEFVGVFWMEGGFGDLRVILAGFESRRAGLDPLVENPHDPWQRPMNYPRIWLSLTPLGLTQEHITPVGVGLALAFYASVFLWAGRISAGLGVVLGLVLCSAPALMAVLRGNNDLVVFILLAGLALAVRCQPRWRGFVPLALLLLAALKYFPILGMAILGRERSRLALSLGAGALVLFAALLLFTWDEPLRVSQATPRPERNAYGRGVGPELLANWGRPVDRGFWAVGSLAACGLLLVLAWPLSSRCLVPVANDDRADDFLLGAGIFLGSFLFGNNWNYRLIFLLFLVPQAYHWAAAGGVRGRVALGLLVALLLGLWAEYPLCRYYPWEPWVMLEQGALWVAFILTATLTFVLWRAAPVQSCS